MKKIIPLLMAILAFIPASAVTITCVDEGNNIVRIDYDATGEISLPKAFGLNVTVDNGAVIQQVFDYKVGDSNITSPGYGIFPGAIKINDAGQIIDWGKPDVNDGSLGTLGGTGTSGVTLLMLSRYSGSQNAPLIKGLLCRIKVNTNSEQIVHVQISQNTRAGGVVLENGSIAQFNGIGCTLKTSTIPPEPTAPPTPISIGYPTSSNTGKYLVEWSASEGASSYQLERSKDGGSWSNVYSGSITTYSEDITNNGNFRYRVCARNNIGSSDWLTGSWLCVVSIPTPISVPERPASINYPSRSDTGQYVINWTASANASSYNLERSTNGRSWTQIYSGPNTSYQENVENGRYYYRVNASNTEGLSSWTTGQSCRVNINTRSNTPSAPSSISYPTSNITGSYSISWSSTNRRDSYQLERSGNEGNDPWILVYSGSSTSWSENIVNGKYYYRVRAENNGNYSSWTTGSYYCEVNITSGYYDDHVYLGGGDD